MRDNVKSFFIGVFFVLATLAIMAQVTGNFDAIRFTTTITLRSGSGSPESSVTAPIGSLYFRSSDGHTWRKDTGSGDTGWVDVTSTGSGAPTDATYITQTANGSLSAEQAIGALSSGILRGATTTGVITSLGDTLPIANGGTNLTSATDDNLMVGNGTTFQLKALADCDDTGGNHLNYDTGTNAFSCGTSGTGGGSRWDQITAMNTTATTANGNNTLIVNFASTTAAQVSWLFGETTAATNGGAASSTTQAILGAATLSTSTAIPILVNNFGGGPSFRVNDVSGDTTPFCVDSGGSVAINGGGGSGCQPDTLLSIGASNGAYSTYWNDGTDQIGIFSDTNKASIGTKTAHPFSLFSSNGNPHLMVRTTSTGAIDILKHAAPPTSFSTGSAGLDDSYLHLGGDDATTNGYYILSFGYAAATNCGNCGTAPPAFIGFQDIVNSGNTKGDLVFATRDVTTDTAATIRMRILADGSVTMTTLTATGSASSKNVVCVDTSTGKLYASSTGTDCTN